MTSSIRSSLSDLFKPGPFPCQQLHLGACLAQAAVLVVKLPIRFTDLQARRTKSSHAGPPHCREAAPRASENSFALLEGTQKIVLITPRSNLQGETALTSTLITRFLASLSCTCRAQSASYVRQTGSASLLEIAPCLRLAVQPNISCSAVSQLHVDSTCLGITDELLTKQSLSSRLCSLAITLLLCHRKHAQCTSSQDMHWRGCGLHLYDWLKRHASLQAKVLTLKPAAFTCRLQSGMSCNHVQDCMTLAATLPQLSCTGKGLHISQTLCLC